ncbi:MULTISPECIES: hypothetical protein [Pseudoalteromonas]|uniref:Imelysin-like domain-containing protein n=1 Tax=Pseudoalteromonas amylolytica TaxID=1859457 RepID=A0A1S1MPX4_9GAMM|nr:MULTISPECIES: hypothetical protein [Pseudoalteromonas]OHU84392.1 hypothetical protein BFC16_01770 [Pseudoalteromonas sp. JW3]OHU87068.1 hypothetical protein BET10_00165 [Pseudoalteromonas amylolytica]
MKALYLTFVLALVVLLSGCKASPDVSQTTSYVDTSKKAKEIAKSYVDILNTTSMVDLMLSGQTSFNPCELPEFQKLSRCKAKHNEDKVQSYYQSVIARVAAQSEIPPRVTRVPTSLAGPQYKTSKEWQLIALAGATSNYYKALEKIAKQDGKAKVEKHFETALKEAEKVDKVLGFVGGPQIFKAILEAFKDIVSSINKAKVESKKRDQIIALIQAQSWLPRVMSTHQACEQRNQARAVKGNGLGEQEQCDIASIIGQCKNMTDLEGFEGDGVKKAQFKKACEKLKYYNTYSDGIVVSSVTHVHDTLAQIEAKQQGHELSARLELFKLQAQLVKSLRDFLVMTKALESTMAKAATANEKALASAKNGKFDIAYTFKLLSELYKGVDEGIEAFDKATSSDQKAVD